MSRAAAREAVRSQFKYFTVNEEEAFSVFGRSEVTGINPIRQTTDVPCLVLFVIMLVLMCLLDFNAQSYGNTLRFAEPIDYKGRLCGYDEEVKDRPLSYHPNPFNDMLVCVSTCPKTAADGTFTLPDGPMGKLYTRTAYPTAKIYGQHCLPLDLSLAQMVISVKSVQTEMYRALGSVFIARDIVLLIMIVPLTTGLVYIVLLFYFPTAACIFAFAGTTVVLGLVGMIIDLDYEVLKTIPLYHEIHPTMLAMQPYFRNGCYVGSAVYATFLVICIPQFARAHLVFKECMAAIINKNVLVVVMVSLFISVVRISFICHVCSNAALLMSILNPVQVKVQLFGEWNLVGRNTWSPFFLKGGLFYAFGTYWILEFMSFCNKYITSQIICHNYFSLKALNSGGQELRHGSSSPLWYACYSLTRYHLGSVAYAALLAFPARAVRFFILFFVPDRPNLNNSLNQQYRIAYYLFWPLIQLDIYFLRFFKDDVWVMLPLKGYKYMDAARRAEGLMNRSRGKIPNLTKFTGRIDAFINLSTGLTTFFWTFFLYREPRHGRYHEVQHIDSMESVRGMWETPEHSPLLAMPIIFAFGFWVGNGMLHVVGMASQTLTMCYCIDVEMVGGTETDALYVPATLKDVYKDLGGGESERELSEMLAQEDMIG